MKQIILIFALIYSVFSSERALNMVIREGDSCHQSGDLDNDSGVSGCVDRDLYDNSSYFRYYDRCCYMRYMEQGQMKGTCFGIRREEYMDIVDAIHNIEREGVHHLRWAGIEPRRNGIRFAPGDLHDHSAGIKIYELNCKSSYLQFALVFALLSFLF